MIPAPFRYSRPDSVDDVLSLMAEHGDEAKLIAGGHSLLPMMKLRLVSPSVLIDLGGVAELSEITVDSDDLVIGATTRHAKVATSELVRSDAPLLAHSAGQVGDPQIRHRGTLGGSLAHADPAADLPMAVVASGGVIEATGPSGKRFVAAEDFFTGYFETSLGEDELVTAVRIPRRPGIGWGYEKFTRRANDWAIVGVATVAGRVVLGNMGGAPIRASGTEQALASGATIAEAAALAAEGTEPGEDMHADREFRYHLARVLTGRALAQAAAEQGRRMVPLRRGSTLHAWTKLETPVSPVPNRPTSSMQVADP